MKKIISILLSITCIATAFTACTTSEENSSSAPAVEEEKKVVYAGTHIYETEDTAQKLVNNGTTAYQLVLPTVKGSYLKTAQTEFTYFFEKATGITVSARSDEDLQATDGKYISLGNTKLLEQSGITYNASELTTNGFQIVTKEDDIYLIGGDENGVLFAVYAFMNVYFNYEQYFIDCYEIDENVKNVAFKKMNIKDIPDIPARAPAYGVLTDVYTSYDEQMFRNRFRYGIAGEDRPTTLPIYNKFDNINGGREFIHNTDAYVNPKDYPDHDEWFSDRGNQLCYTAHGDEEEFNLLVEECAKKIENSLKIHTPDKEPRKNIVTITMEDNYNTCACDKCLELKEKYGTETGAVIIFVNELNKRVRAWMNQPENALYKRDELKIVFFAYNTFTLAPAKYNEATQKYEPIDEAVAMDDGVGVYLAPIDLDYSQSLFSEINEGGKKNIDAWSDLSNKNMLLWTYSTNFYHFMFQYDSLEFFKDAYAYFANAGAKEWFNQGQHSQYGTTTAWHNLKMYLDSKLMWNSSLNVQELIDNWFDGMFKEGAETMKSLYNEMRSYQHTLATEHNLYMLNSIYSNVEETGSWWPLPTMLSWMNKVDEAKKAVSHYATTNPALYQALCDHMDAEWLSPAYIVLKYHKGSLKEGERNTLIARFSEFVNRSGITNYHQSNGKLDSFIADL